MRAQHVLDLLDDAVEVGADAVQLVDEDDAGNFGFVGVAPVGLRLGLDAAGSAEYADAAVEYLQRAIDLDREIHVSRGVDDVEPVIRPLAAGRSRLNRNAAFLLLLHEVRGRFTVMNLAGPVDLARQLQDTLRRRGFARIDVRENSNISVNAKVFHVTALKFQFIPHTRNGLSKPSTSENPTNQSRWVHVSAVGPRRTSRRLMRCRKRVGRANGRG